MWVKIMCDLEKKLKTVKLTYEESQPVRQISAWVTTANKIQRIGLIEKVVFEQTV